MKTLQQAKEEFRFRGQSVSDWARDNGFNPDMVRRVLRGLYKCYRGDAHKIAVKLGVKEGIIYE